MVLIIQLNKSEMDFDKFDEIPVAREQDSCTLTKMVNDYVRVACLSPNKK